MKLDELSLIYSQIKTFEQFCCKPPSQWLTYGVSIFSEVHSDLLVVHRYPWLLIKFHPIQDKATAHPVPFSDLADTIALIWSRIVVLEWSESLKQWIWQQISIQVQRWHGNLGRKSRKHVQPLQLWQLIYPFNHADGFLCFAILIVMMKVPTWQSVFRTKDIF